MKGSICEKEITVSVRHYQENGVWKCLHDDPSIGSNPLEARRRANREQTMRAKTMASSADRERRQNNPDVTLSPIDRPGNRSPYGQQPVTVPKSVLDNLTQKAKDANY